MSGEEPAPQIAPVEFPQMTTQALLARQRERKAESILLLAITDEYQLRFHTIKDAKSLWAAIKSRFGGNVESKKMQKTVLKQQFENFSISNKEGLDKAYDRARRFLKNTKRKLDMDNKERIRFDKSNVECVNCHKRGHFAREWRAPRNQDNMNKEPTRRTIPVKETTLNALVSQCDGFSYD
nr:ribonuclease H-like domain-containing protein [Tanacetum cinerariifolium]